MLSSPPDVAGAGDGGDAVVTEDANGAKAPPLMAPVIGISYQARSFEGADPTGLGEPAEVGVASRCNGSL